MPQQAAIVKFFERLETLAFAMAVYLENLAERLNVLFSDILFAIIIGHFHYDVTSAKVSGSCSKDRAQCRAIAGKCQKISIKRHVDQVKLPGVSQSYVLDCYTNSKKFSVEFFVFFFR